MAAGPASDAADGAPARMQSRTRVVVLVCRTDPWMSALRRALRTTLPPAASLRHTDTGWAGMVIDADTDTDTVKPDPAWRSLAATLDGVTAPNLLLAVTIPSSSMLSGTDMADTSLRALHALLSSRFHDVRAVAWVRAPREAMEAALQETLVAGRGRPPLELASLYPRYRDLFATLDEVFGREQVTLAKLETHALPAGDILQGLNIWLGLGIPGDQRARPAPAWLSPAPLACLYAYRDRYPDAGNATQAMTRQRLARVLGRLRGRRLRLSPDVLRPLFVRQCEDITWMELRLGMPLSEDMSANAADVVALPLLAQVSAETREQLRRLVGDRGEDALTEPADLVDRLRRQIDAWPDDADAQAAALGRLFNRAVPRAMDTLAGLPPAQAVGLLHAAFAALRAEVCAMTDVPVGLSAFGQFKRVPAGPGADDGAPVQFFPLT